MQVEGTATGGKCACIKHVPELQEDKCGEEQTEFVRVQAFVVRYESGMENIGQRVDVDMLHVPH